jgi:hypothetical protein
MRSKTSSYPDSTKQAVKKGTIISITLNIKPPQFYYILRWRKCQINAEGRELNPPGLLLRLPLPIRADKGRLHNHIKIYGRCQMDELQEILNDIRERLVRVETKIDDNLKGRLDKMEDNQKWLWRTAVGGFITAIIAFIVKWGGK